MIKKGSLYSASDKAFYDALRQHKMSKPALHDLMWRRGIICSSKAEKQDIAKYFSRLEHDYFDHKLISEKISTGSGREKKSSSFMNGKVDIGIVEAVAKELIDDRKEIDNSISFTMSEKSVNIEVSYSYYDHNKPEFKQLVTKNALIVVECSEEKVSIRSPDNEYVSNISESIISGIQSRLKEELDVEGISLFGIDDVESRIQFFISLINGMENMDLRDVSDVAVYNPETGAEEKDVVAHVKKASLNGAGVLNAGELKQFYRKGFFVYRISWSAVEIHNVSSDIYNFQAQFNDPEHCRKFSYLVKGSNRFRGKGDYVKTPSALKQSEETRMFRKLEESARKAKQSVFGSLNSGDE